MDWHTLIAAGIGVVALAIALRELAAGRASWRPSE